MILYYQENNGDYLAIDTDSNRHYLRLYGKDYFEGRATAIQGQLQLRRCSSKYFQQKIVVPTTTAAFHHDAVASGMLLQQR